MSPPRLKLDVAELVRLYVEEQMDMRTIGARFGCSPSTIRNRLLEEEVQLRREGRPDAKHGTDQAWRNGCRCGPCIAAHEAELPKRRGRWRRRVVRESARR